MHLLAVDRVCISQPIGDNSGLNVLEQRNEGLEGVGGLHGLEGQAARFTCCWFKALKNAPVQDVDRGRRNVA